MGSSHSELVETESWRNQFVAPAGVEFAEETVPAAASSAGSSEASALLASPKRMTHWIRWIPQGGSVKGVVIVAHGLHEHSLRYHDLCCVLATRGYAMYAIDHMAHGKSRIDGPGHVPALIDSHVQMRDDFVAFAARMRARHAENTPLFLLGHSMGSLVVLSAVHSISNVAGIFISGCATVPGPAAASPFGCTCLYPVTRTGCAVKLASCLASCDPNGPAAPILVNGLSTSPDVLAAHELDPRIYHGSTRNKTAFELLTMTASVKEQVPAIKQPICFHHGEDDPVTLPEGAEWCFAHVATPAEHKRLTVHAGLLHELFSEKIKGPAICAAAGDFFDQYLGGGTSSAAAQITLGV